MKALTFLGGFAYFCVDFFRAAARRPPPPGRTLEEAYKIGVQSLPVLATISVFVGTNLALQGYNAFLPIGGQRLVGTFVALAGVRELAPFIAAAMVAAKAGTEMASQIAVMRTREQIDALEVMAVDPHWYLVTPRFLAIVLVMPALTVLSVGIVICASWLVVTWQLGQNGTEFLSLVREAIAGRDLVAGILKAAVFGAVICLMSCFCGFRSDRGPEGVGRATNAAVVISAVVCVSVNFLVSQVMYGR